MRLRNHRRLARPLAAAALLAPVALSSASRGASFDYDIRADGKGVGSVHVEATRESTGNGWIERVRSTTNIEVRVLFVKVFSLESVEDEERDGRGLRRFASRARIDGAELQVEGVRTDAGFSLELHHEGGTKRIAIRREDYDLTSADPVLDLLAEPGARRVLRVLDLDRLEVVSRTFEWLRSEPVEIGSRSMASRVVSFTDRYASGTRWYAAGESDLLLREEGTDEDGPYSIVIRSDEGR